MKFNKKLKDISVIIRNKNEERWIGHCIQSCLENFIAPEVIIVNHKSVDSSLEIAKSFRHDPSLKPSIKNYCDLKILHIDDYSPGRAINFGVQKASQKYICVLSAHCVIQSVNQKILAASLKKYPCVFGKQIPVYRGKKINPRYIWSHFVDSEVENMYSKQEERLFLHNAFCFYQKEILMELPFNEDLTSKEDRLWALSLSKLKKSFLYSPDLVAHHHYTNSGNTWKGIA